MSKEIDLKLFQNDQNEDINKNLTNPSNNFVFQNK